MATIQSRRLVTTYGYDALATTTNPLKVTTTALLEKLYSPDLYCLKLGKGMRTGNQ